VRHCVGGVYVVYYDLLLSDRRQELREKSLRDFYNQQKMVLVATDVMARGIDIKELDHVSLSLLDYLRNDIVFELCFYSPLGRQLRDASRSRHLRAQNWENWKIAARSCYELL